MTECSPYSTTSSIWAISFILISAILRGVRWNLKVFLICISPVDKDVEHLSVPQPFEFPLLRSLYLGLYSIFSWIIWCFFFFISSYLTSLFIFYVVLVKTFPHFAGCHFAQMMLSFALQKLFSFKRPVLLILMPVLSVFCSRSFLLCQWVQDYSQFLFYWA
jgi:hypothetical protein